MKKILEKLTNITYLGFLWISTIFWLFTVIVCLFIIVNRHEDVLMIGASEGWRIAFRPKESWRPILGCLIFFGVLFISNVHTLYRRYHKNSNRSKKITQRVKMIEFLEKLSDNYFKRVNDHLVFYPWGFGTGYVVSTKEQNLLIRRFLKQFHLMAFLWLLLFFILSIMNLIFIKYMIKWEMQDMRLIVWLPLLPLLFVTYIIQVRRLTNNLEKTSKRLTLRENILEENQKISDVFYLWFGVIFFLGTIISGIIIILYTPEYHLLASVSIILLSFPLFISIYRLYLKFLGSSSIKDFSKKISSKSQ